MNCPICKSSNTRLFNIDSYFYRCFINSKNSLDNSKNINNYLCNKCGLIFQSPQPSLKELDFIYSSSYRETGTIVKSKDISLTMPIDLMSTVNSFQRAQSLIDIFQNLNLFPKPGLYLDYGGYQGAFAWAISEAFGLNGYIADFNKPGLKFANKFLGLNTIQLSHNSNLNEILPDKLSLVSLVHSLEHLTQPINVLKSIYSKLNNGSYLYIEVPNSCGSALNDPTHLFVFSKSSLSYLLSSLGYKILYLQAGFLSHSSEPELNNSEVVLRCLAIKDLNNNSQDSYLNYYKYKKNNMFYFKLYLKHFIYSLNTIYLYLIDLLKIIIKRFFNITYFLIYDFLPFGKKIYYKIKRKKK